MFNIVESLGDFAGEHPLIYDLVILYQWKS